MELSLILAAVLSFTPTLILMYAVLRKYTYPAVQQPFFSDPSFFTLFAVGLVVGTLMLAFYTYLMTNILYSLIFYFLEVLIMVAALNLKRYHGKSDTVFYGYGLGLGIGCTFAFGMIYYLARISFAAGSVDVAGYATLTIIGVAEIMTFASVGTTVGEGIARLRVNEFMMKGLLMNLAFGVVVTASIMSSGSWVFYAGLAFALLISAGYFTRTLVKNLPGVVAEVLKMEGKKRNDLPK